MLAGFVSDAPRVTSALAPSIDPRSIKEGDDVYFECRVNANPAPKSIVWMHQVSTRTHWSLASGEHPHVKLQDALEKTVTTVWGPTVLRHGRVRSDGERSRTGRARL